MPMSNKKTTSDIILEKIPPLFGYCLILFPIVMSFIEPDIAGIYIIMVVVYFFYKSFSSMIFFAYSLWKIRESEQVDWNKLVLGLEDVELEVSRLEQQKQLILNFTWEQFNKEDKKDGTDDIADQFSKYKNKSLPGFYKKILFKFEKRKTLKFIDKQLNRYKRLSERKGLMKPSELQHILIIPFVNEPYTLLKETVECVRKQTFNTKQINLVFASEAAVKHGQEIAKQLKAEYEQYFNNIWISEHVLQPEDAIGKSANMNWASRMVYEEVLKLGWDTEKTTITSCDSDSKIDVQYYASVTYKYITQENAKYKIFTAALVFYNNIWRLPFYARVKNSFSSIYNVAKMARQDRLVPVSTYTLSLWMVKEIDFWTPWVTPEDYHIFFKCLFKYDRYVETVPIFLKTLSDAAEGDGHWDTIKNNYKQSRRWAWGISDTGWMIKNLIKGWSRHSLRAKYKALHVISDHIMGPNLALIIIFGGNLPVLLNPAFGDEVFGTLLPQVTQAVIRVTLIFLIIIIFLDFYLKPRPEKDTWPRRILHFLEWFSQPIGGFFLAALPGLESQTRLIFGKYMEYYVTKKKGNDEEKVS